jgi:DNA-binding PadR family transcriptional regulator
MLKGVKNIMRHCASTFFEWPLFFSSGFDCGGSHGPGPGRGGRGPSWFFELFGGPHRRAERGEVRYLILDVVREKARHGYEIIQAIEEKTRGAYRPSPGTIYPTLQMLEELGHTRSREEGGKRLYEITDEGKADLERHSEEVEEAYDRLKGENEWLDTSEIHVLMKRIHRLMRHLGRAFRRGRVGKGELRSISQILEQAMTRIEELLGKDEG